MSPCFDFLNSEEKRDFILHFWTGRERPFPPIGHETEIWLSDIRRGIERTVEDRVDQPLGEALEVTSLALESI